MSETKHTPGPWAAVHNEHYWQISSERDGQIGDACASDYIYHDGAQIDSTEIAAANARLMAAAPDLLAACAAVESEYRDGYGLNCIKQLRAAIQRATEA